MKNIAKTELLENFITGEGNTLHAEWLKSNSVRVTKVIFKIGESTHVPNYEK